MTVVATHFISLINDIPVYICKLHLQEDLHDHYVAVDGQWKPKLFPTLCDNCSKSTICFHRARMIQSMLDAEHLVSTNVFCQYQRAIMQERVVNVIVDFASCACDAHIY